MYLLYVVVFLLPHSPKHWVTSSASYGVALLACACKRIEPNGDGSFRPVPAKELSPMETAPSRPSSSSIQESWWWQTERVLVLVISFFTQLFDTRKSVYTVVAVSQDFLAFWPCRWVRFMRRKKSRDTGTLKEQTLLVFGLCFS